MFAWRSDIYLASSLFTIDKTLITLQLLNESGDIQTLQVKDVTSDLRIVFVIYS